MCECVCPAESARVGKEKQVKNLKKPNNTRSVKAETKTRHTSDEEEINDAKNQKGCN